MASLSEIFGDSAQVKVVDFLLHNLKETMMMSDVAKGAGVANSTTARVVEPLIQTGLVKETRIGRQIRIIRINQEDERTRLLLTLVEQMEGLEDRKKPAEKGEIPRKPHRELGKSTNDNKLT